MSRRHFLLQASLAMLAACLPTMAQAAPPIKPAELACHFRATTNATGQVLLQFTLRNTSRHDLHLLRWGSPFEGAWFGPFVQASTPLGDLPFQGAMRKRGEPAARDYLLLPAGQRLSAELRLADAYTWPAQDPGPLQLKAAWHWHDLIVQGAQKPPRPRARHQGLDQACGEVTVGR